jgi:hypothetical protein
VGEGFGTSARKGKNGFVDMKIVSSQGLRRNNSEENANKFRKICFCRVLAQPLPA